MKFLKIRKNLLFVFVICITLALSGCENSIEIPSNAETYSQTNITQSSGTKSKSTKAKDKKEETTEIKTIEPPEDGWTLEDLLSVTYIYGNQLTVPCTLENLGDDFSFDKSDFKKHSERNIGITTLNYKSIPIAGVSVNEVNMKKINSNTEILNVFFSLLFENDNENNIIVNGIDFNCTKNQVISSFGEPNVSKENFISYYNAETEERILAFNFDDEGNVIGIHIILYDYV